MNIGLKRLVRMIASILLKKDLLLTPSSRAVNRSRAISVPSKQPESCLGLIPLQIFKEEFVLLMNLKTGPRFADIWQSVIINLYWFPMSLNCVIYKWQGEKFRINYIGQKWRGGKKTDNCNQKQDLSQTL